MSRDFVLGLDGGGSKTILAVADRHGSIMALHRGPGLDPHDNPQWRDDFAGMVQAIGTRAGDLRRAVLGLSCHTESRAISEAQTAWVGGLFAIPSDVLNDVHVAFEGAFAGRAGVLALAGTGSMAWAGDGRGSHRRAGGWGDLIGDEGSGYWIGREALSETTRALDGRAGSEDFANRLLDHLGLGRGDLIAWVYGLRNRRSAIAALAVFVDRLAASGDPTARAMIERAADHLCDQVEAAWRLLGLPQPLVWTHAGGLFEGALIGPHMQKRLGPPVAPALPPVGGAILLAAQRSGWTTDAAWRSRLAAALADVIRPGGVPEHSEQGWTA